MALIKKFCCGCNVRSGSIFSGFYCLVSSALFVALLCVRYVGYRLVDSSQTYAIAAYATVALFMLLLATSVTLVIGVYLDIQMLFVPWLVIVVLSILEASAALVWYIINRLRSDQIIPEWEIAITSYHLVNSIILVYCMVCVISQLQDLMAGKGTSRYYRRRRHLHRQRLPPHLTPIPIELLDSPPPELRPPPHGCGPAVPPPPYIDQPPPYHTHVSAGFGEEPANTSADINSNTESLPGDTGALERADARHDSGRTAQHLDSVDSTGSLRMTGDNERLSASAVRHNPQPLTSFHFGDVDLILPIPAELPSAHVREHSPSGRHESSRHRKKKKKLEKRKRVDRLRTNECGLARGPHPHRPHPAQVHARRTDAPRIAVAHRAPGPPPGTSMRPFPPSPRNSPTL